MPKKTNRARRPKLPSVIALPLPKRPYPSPDTITKRTRQTAPDDIYVPPGIFESADALTAVIALVRDFFPVGGDDHYEDVVGWLDNLDGYIGELERSITEGWFEKHPTDNTVGIGDLRELANDAPDVESRIDELISPAAGYALLFWIEEIQRRTNELCDISIQCVNSVEARNTFNTIRDLRYPISGSERSE